MSDRGNAAAADLSPINHDQDSTFSASQLKVESFPAIQHPMQAHHHRLTWCVTEMTARCTLSGALNGSQKTQNCAAIDWNVTHTLC